jgi:pilus assembly protein Flp/PilA
MKNFIVSIVSDEQGQDLIEYALLAGLISILCIVAVKSAGSKVSSLFSSVNSALP